MSFNLIFSHFYTISNFYSSLTHFQLYLHHVLFLSNSDFFLIYIPFPIAKLDGVKTYMRMRRVPNHLQIKVIKWFDYLWLSQKCSDEERAVSCLPDKLKVRIQSNYIVVDIFRFRSMTFSKNIFVCHP